MSDYFEQRKAEIKANPALIGGATSRPQPRKRATKAESQWIGPGVGFVYLVLSEEQGCGKIGFCSEHPSIRLGQMQTGNPSPLTLEIYIPGSRCLEGTIQKALKPYRKKREWFTNIGLLRNVFECLETDAYDGDDEPAELSTSAAEKAVSEGIEDFFFGDE